MGEGFVVGEDAAVPRSGAYVEFSLGEAGDDFSVSFVKITTPDGDGVSDCGFVNLDRYDEASSTFKTAAVCKLVDGVAQTEVPGADDVSSASSTIWRLSAFGGSSATGTCSVESISLTIQPKDEYQFAALVLPYANEDAVETCSACQKCFAGEYKEVDGIKSAVGGLTGCRRYSDSPTFRFKACVGTSESCRRGPGVEDEDGEATFVGVPFESDLTSLKFRGYEWSGLLPFREQKAPTSADAHQDWNCYLHRYGPSKIAPASRYPFNKAGAERHWREVGDKQGWLWGCFAGYYDDHAYMEGRSGYAITSVKFPLMPHSFAFVAENKEWTTPFTVLRKNSHPLVTTATALSCQNLAQSSNHKTCLDKCYSDPECKEVWAYDNGRCCMKAGSDVTKGWRTINGGTYYQRNARGWSGDMLGKGVNIRLAVLETNAAEKGFTYMTTFEPASVAARPRDVDLPIRFAITGGNSATRGAQICGGSATSCAAFDIDPVSGQIFVVRENVMHQPSRSTWTLDVTATDQGGKKATGKMIVTILPGNDPPTIKPCKRTVDENARGRALSGGVITATDEQVTIGDQRLTFAITAGDAMGYFTINPTTGELKTTGTAKLDFEMQSVYQLTVRAQDNGPGELSDSAVVTVAISDVNENPWLEPHRLTVLENSPLNLIGNGGFVNGQPVENEYGSYDGKNAQGEWISSEKNGCEKITCGARTIRAEPSGPPGLRSYSGYVLEFGPPKAGVHQSGVPRQGEYEIHEAPDAQMSNLGGEFRVCAWSKVSRDYDGKEQLLASRFWDEDKQVLGETQGGFPQKRDVWEYICVSKDLGETSTLGSFAVYVGYPLQNTKGTILVTDIGVFHGSKLSPAVQGSDVDAGDKLTYAIMDDNLPEFSIDSLTGVISVNGPINYEREAFYNINVKVTDAAGLTGAGVVAVKVVDGNDGPFLPNTARVISEAATQGVGVGQSLAVFDEDRGDTFTYRIVSGNGPADTGLRHAGHRIPVARDRAVGERSLRRQPRDADRWARVHRTADDWRRARRENVGALHRFRASPQSRCAGGGCSGGKGVNLDCHYHGASGQAELSLAYGFSYVMNTGREREVEDQHRFGRRSHDVVEW